MARKQPPRKPSLDDGVVRLTARYAGKLSPPMEGLAYRFTIWLPVQSSGEPVFAKEHQAQLFKLFAACFGGWSQSTLEGFPPWTGSWLPAGSDEPITDQHILLIVYSRQAAEAVTCIQQLKWLLQQNHIAAQQVVLIEQVPVQFVEAIEPT